jgi:ACS family D-galactonate transporter-like MFS transporter
LIPRAVSVNAPPGTIVSPVRWRILALLATGTMINFLNRTVLGVTAPSLTAELKLSPEVMGIVLSAFSWSYVAAQLPAGWFLDRFKD